MNEQKPELGMMGGQAFGATEQSRIATAKQNAINRSEYIKLPISAVDGNEYLADAEGNFIAQAWTRDHRPLMPIIARAVNAHGAATGWDKPCPHWDAPLPGTQIELLDKFAHALSSLTSTMPNDDIKEVWECFWDLDRRLRLEGEGATFECINCDAPVEREGQDCGKCSSQTPSWKFREGKEA